MIMRIRDERGNFIEVPLGAVSDEQIAEAVAEYLAENPNTSGGADLSNYYPKEETDNLLAQKADKATTLEGYGITDAYSKSEVNTIHTGLNVRIGTLEQEVDTKVDANFVNTAISASAYGKTQVDNMVGDINSDLDEMQESIDKKTEETVLHEVTVNTPTWVYQPACDTDVASVFTAGDIYYVTLKDTAGSALPDGQFKLMNFVDEYATAYEAVFTLTDLDTGNAETLTENMPVEFTEDYLLRNAGVNTVSFDINKSMDSALNLKITAIGEFLKQGTADYVGVYFFTDKNVSNYHSSAATTWNSDAGKYIWNFINQGNELTKVHKFRDDFSISKKADNYFITERKHLSRVLPNGTTTYKNYTAQTIGFGAAETGTVLTKVCLYSVRVPSGYFRNGTVVRVTEVK